MRIGELAERTGASVRSLRYYGEQGLLDSSRTPGGQREYDDGDVARVEWLRLLLAAGMTTAGIRELLPCTLSGRTTAAQRELLHHDRDRIVAQIAQLEETRRRLDAIIAYAEEHPESASAA
jgi:DNA-binding transcriptional MerR regulator